MNFYHTRGVDPSTAEDNCFDTDSLLTGNPKWFYYLKIILGGLPPILLNGLIIPLVIIFGMGSTESYLFLFMTISIGELIAIYVVGGLMYFPLKKMFEGFGINSQ